MPLTLPEHARLHIANRLMLQQPVDQTPEQLAEYGRFLARKFNDIPGDVLITLDALRLLADQGNRVARDLFDDEVERLGLTRATHFGP